MAGSNGPSWLERAVWRGQAGRDRPPDAARRSRSIGLDAIPERGGEQRRVDERRQECSERPGERVRAALHAAVGVQQARRVQAAGARSLRQCRDRLAARHGVRVQQHGDRLPHARDREVVGGAEAGVVAPDDHFGAVRSRQIRPAVVGAGVDHDQPRGCEGGQQRGELVARAVQHDDDGEGGHRAALRRSALAPACRRRFQVEVSRLCLAGPDTADSPPTVPVCSPARPAVIGSSPRRAPPRSARPSRGRRTPLPPGGGRRRGLRGRREPRAARRRRRRRCRVDRGARRRL